MFGLYVQRLKAEAAALAVADHELRSLMTFFGGGCWSGVGFRVEGLGSCTPVSLFLL